MPALGQLNVICDDSTQSSARQGVWAQGESSPMGGETRLNEPPGEHSWETPGGGNRGAGGSPVQPGGLRKREIARIPAASEVWQGGEPGAVRAEGIASGSGAGLARVPVEGPGSCGRTLRTRPPSGSRFGRKGT